MAAVKVFHVCPPGPARAGLALAAGCRRSPQAPRARLERLRGPCGHALLILKTVLKVNLFPKRSRGRYGLRPQRSWPGRGVPGPAGLALWAWCFPVGAALCPGARAPARGGAPGRWPGLPGRVVGASGLAGPGLRGFARPARFLLVRGRVPRCGRLVVPGPRRRAPGAGPCAPRFAQPPVRGSPARCGLPGLRPGPGGRPGGPLAPGPHGLLKDIRIPNPFPPGSAPPELPPWVPWPWPPGCARGRCLPAGPARGTPGPARGAAPGGGAPVRPVFPVPRSAGPRLPCAPAPSSARCFGARFPAFPSRQGVFMLTLIFNFN